MSILRKDLERLIKEGRVEVEFGNVEIDKRVEVRSCSTGRRKHVDILEVKEQWYLIKNLIKTELRVEPSPEMKEFYLDEGYTITRVREFSERKVHIKSWSPLTYEEVRQRQNFLNIQHKGE